MKQRISRDKQIKKSIEPKNEKSSKRKAKITPMNTLNFLIKHNHNMGHITQFEKSRIQQIIERGTSRELRFRQFITSLQEQQYLRKAYSFSDVMHIFTNLIQKSSQTKVSCFLKFQNSSGFKIMKRYRTQQKMRGICGKAKDEVNQTATRSFSEGRRAQQMMVRAQQLLTRPNQNQKIIHNSSLSDIEAIVKGIQKMIKNHTKQPESPQIKSMDFKPIFPINEINMPDISRIHSDRVHTTPQTMACDNYGLGQYICPKEIKSKGMASSSRVTKIQKNDHQKPMIRFHTEYDTQYIVESKKTKSKSKQKLTSFSKKSFSKKRPLEKARSPVGMRMGLKLKK